MILVGMGSLINKLYELDCEPAIQEHASLASQKRNKIYLWDQRLGHLGNQQMKEIVTKQLMKGMSILKTEELSFCESCTEGKMHRKSFDSVGEVHSTRKLQCVHSNVCEPMLTESIEGKKYFVFIDVYSRYNQVYFM